MTYIGNTQNYLKEGINQHLYQTKNYVNAGNSSDTFAKHFGEHFTSVANGGEKIKAKDAQTYSRKPTPTTPHT